MGIKEELKERQAMELEKGKSLILSGISYCEDHPQELLHLLLAQAIKVANTLPEKRGHAIVKLKLEEASLLFAGCQLKQDF